jgi:hypothetical protein
VKKDTFVFVQSAHEMHMDRCLPNTQSLVTSHFENEPAFFALRVISLAEKVVAIVS